ncbi:DUF2207 domain-containing protein [Hippea maritima]|uniref:DUF2207 domain-containing protein n=1 Tax=Hippea maritima (strain ATCC 700847 / DSM 10411 / MH2) TaxID=760142 RepID=F2LVD8_HIPMA|nr:DUF2207 domain-containing protein [Hippea maritima]AEA33722.1 Protein of unknown function DUF2207, membrane [Hippea maritima DSM 10411]
MSFKWVLFFVFLPLLAHAEYFYIKDFHSDIYLNENGVVDIDETIKVHFNRPRHGIFRFIPYEYRVNRTFGNGRSFGRIYKISIFNVEVDGFKYKIKRSDGKLIIKIGSPKAYVKGDAVYKIHYSMFGVINYFKNHAEFYYNAVGNGWPVSILKSSFDLYLPKKLSKNDIKFKVFSGLYGSKHTEDITYSNGVLSCYLNHTLKSHEGLTVVLGFPKDYINSSGFWLRLRLFLNNNSIFALPLFVFLVLYAIWYAIGRDVKKPIAVYYRPPKDMTPAEAGVLVDDEINNSDLLSLIFYWASKGYLEIEENENKKAFFKKKDLILKKLKDLPDSAKSFEKIIFYGLFDNRDVVRVSSLKNKFYETINEARNSLDSYIKELKLYEKGTRKFGLILKMLAFIVGGSTVFFFIETGLNYAIAFFVTAVVLFIFGKIMPKKSLKGVEQFSIIRGFREFMRKAEKNRLKRLLDEDPDYFYNTLSYAIALGEHKEWSKKFDDLVSEPPVWYRSQSPYTRFSAYSFATMMDRDMSTLSETLASQPSSSSAAASGSSGFGGSGASGGGFGGGGGGSW